MEAYAGAAPAAGVFAGFGTAATLPFIHLRRRRRGAGGGSPRSSAGRMRLVRAPPLQAAGDPGDLPPLDKWDIMELDFGRFLGEDPKLTLAKVRPVSSYCCLLASDYLVVMARGDEYQDKNAALLTI